MVSIFELIEKKKNVIQDLYKVRGDMILEKEKDELNEADVWLNTSFKEKGLTNDSMRKAYVKKTLISHYPSFYLHKKAKEQKLSEELEWLTQTIEVLMDLGVTEIEFSEDKEDKNEGDGTQGSV